MSGNLEIGVRQIHLDGLVVIQNAIDAAKLEKLNKRMIADALKLRSRGKDTPFNYNPGNLQQDAPPVKEFFEPEIFLSRCSVPFQLHACTDHMNRPNSDTDHVRSAWSSSQIDLLLWQFCNASNSWVSAAKTAGPFRCGF